MKKQKKTPKLGDVHVIGNIHYEVKYINQGISFLTPLDDYPEAGLYYCCVALKIFPDKTLKTV